jgi:hypothetical protein
MSDPFDREEPEPMAFVPASLETLMRQASMTVHDYMVAAVHDIEEVFGKGYAKAHPELVGAFIQTAAMDFNTAVTIKAIEEPLATLAEEMGSIAAGLRMLGTADAATAMSAIEFLAVGIKEGLSELGTRVGELSAAVEGIERDQN